MELISSFGPLGRHKIVSNGAGTILITKDGHNVVPTSNEGGRKTFEQIARSCRITASSRRGDGFLTSEIITRTLLDSTLQGLQELHAPKWRIRYLAAAVAIRSVIQSMQHEIQKCFINMRLWHVEQDCSRRMRALCYTMSFPASNAATAEVLDSILEKWVLSATTGPEQVRDVCRTIHSTFDTLVKRATHPAGASQESYLIMPSDRIILAGRCREYTSLARPAGSAVKVLFLRAVSSADPSAHTSSALQVPSAVSYLQMADGNHAALRRMIAVILRDAGTEGPVAMFCGGAVSDEEADLLSAAGIVLVDCISPAELEYAALRSGCTLYDDPHHLCMVATSLSSRDGVSYGHFSHLERTLLGERSELHYIMCGVAPSGGQQRSPSCAPPQLVLFGSSPLHVGVYVNLLRRCLSVMLYSLGEERDRRDTAEQRSVEDMAVVPGGGAGELGWALLWEKVSAALASDPSSQATREGDVGGGLSEGDVESGLSVLADQVASAVLKRLGTRSADAVVSCRQVCAAISTAYLQVPLQLLHSAIDVLDSGAAAGHSRNQRELLEWRKSYLLGPAAGRVGIVVNADPDSMDICANADAVEGGVYTSLHHFRDVFHEALEQLVLYLRLGGDSGIVLVRRRPAVAQQDPGGSDDD